MVLFKIMLNSINFKSLLTPHEDSTMTCFNFHQLLRLIYLSFCWLLTYQSFCLHDRLNLHPCEPSERFRLSRLTKTNNMLLFYVVVPCIKHDKAVSKRISS